MKCSDDQSDFLGQFLTSFDKELEEYRYEISHLKDRSNDFCPFSYANFEKMKYVITMVKDVSDGEQKSQIESLLAKSGISISQLILFYDKLRYYMCIVPLAIGIIEHGCFKEDSEVLPDVFSLKSNLGQLDNRGIYETLIILPPYIAKFIIKKCCSPNLIEILLPAYISKEKDVFINLDVKYDTSRLSKVCYFCTSRMAIILWHKGHKEDSFDDVKNALKERLPSIIRCVDKSITLDTTDLDSQLNAELSKKGFRRMRNHYFYFLRLIRDGSFDEFTRKCLTEILMENEDYEYMQDLLARFERREQHKNMEYESDPLHFSIAPDKSKEEREEICKELHNMLVSEKLVSYSTTLDQVRFVFGLLGDCRPQGYKAITWIKKSTHGQSVPVLVKLLHTMGVLPNICCQEDIDKLRNCFDLRKPLEVKRVNEYIKKDTYSPEVGKVHDIYKTWSNLFQPSF